ncbi:transcriptional regulator STERILE APETALA [Cornus florida]|uniref:transcriptional regulator STERILE APETALA n=1 Tax=Cornus florida TaxID=4283 RepID=UPI00289B60E4|nr:transcriptional regulator STERILE APETALA [Cornus florida]
MSSSSSSSSQDTEAGGDGGGGRGGGEGPSSSRRRFGNRVWPEPFIEALASQVAIDASRSIDRLAAARALFNVFQVCSTWLAVSRSDLLWQNLTSSIWNRHHLLHDTWCDEYIYRHRTAHNFRVGQYIYSTLHFIPSEDDDNDGLSCRRLALSDNFLAAGFSNGSVRLFHLPTRLHLSTFQSHQRDRIGRFSPAISGIILSDTQLVFASLDGDIHVAATDVGPPARRTHLGNQVNDGVLVDFTGCARWWVGLYAGVPGRAFHVWDGATEELLFVGGTLTDQEAVMGWHLLTELTVLIGRIRITGQESAVACTSPRVIVFDLANQGIVFGEEEFQTGLIVGSVDANNDAFIVVDSRGVASVRRAGTLEEVCRFTVRGASQRSVLGCMNGGYALMCAGGVINVWEVEQQGQHLYRFNERIGEANALIADDRYVAACSSDATIHLWDFGAQ